LRQGMEWMKQAWDEITPGTISNCWRHVKYIAEYEYEELLVLRMRGLQVDANSRTVNQS
jgi:hypothetical protein